MLLDWIKSDETSSTEIGLSISLGMGVSNNRMARIAAWHVIDVVMESADAPDIHRQQCLNQASSVTGASSDKIFLENLGMFDSSKI